MQQRLDEQYSGRTETRQQDLNFVDRPSEAYDIEFANSTITHLVNLDHFAFQVNRGLTPEGRFFMADFVAESYFQFAEEKKRIYQTFIDATRHGAEPPFTIDWPSRDNWTFSPFESVRSGEILDVFGRYLLPLCVRTASAPGSPPVGGGRP